MKSTLLADSGEKTFALVFDEGDEVMRILTDFAAEQKLAASHFNAVGAFSGATLAYFDLKLRDYTNIPVDEQVEVLTLAGNITLRDGKPKVHAHVAVAKSDGTAHGGHLLEARVRPTLELFLSEAPARLERQDDPEAGLALIQL